MATIKSYLNLARDLDKVVSERECLRAKDSFPQHRRDRLSPFPQLTTHPSHSSASTPQPFIIYTPSYRNPPQQICVKLYVRSSGVGGRVSSLNASLVALTPLPLQMSFWLTSKLCAIGTSSNRPMCTLLLAWFQERSLTSIG